MKQDTSTGPAAQPATRLDASPSPPAAAIAARPTRVRWFIFSIIFLLVVINLIDRVSLSIGMPTIAREFQLSPTMQGMILSSFFWAYALLQIPGGWLIDRFGPRKIITGSTLLWGLFQAAAALATGGISLLLSRMALGAAEAPLFPAGGKLNSLWLSSKERGRGAVIMDCGGPLGAALGGIIIAHMIAMLGSWRLVFAIAGGVTILLGWLSWYYLRDNPARHPQVNQGELAAITEAAAHDAGDAPDTPGLGIAPRWLIAMLVGRAAWAMMFFGLLTWGPSYLAQGRGFDLIAIGNATFIIFICGALGSLSGGFLLDALVKAGVRHSVALKSLLSLSGAITLAAFMALPYLTSSYMAVVFLSIAACFLMWGSLYWSLPVLLVAKQHVGVVGGIMNMAGSLGGIMVPILVGVILQKTGSYGGVLLFFAACSAVYILGTCLIKLNVKTGVRS
ncbi:MFS transporter [Sodalis sp. RH21]|uniref:MFS transporter n=1 Tax=unclassified Sodalis (in: enterobacteria) TaxID=2636512 RepID=UPI0039B41323